LLSASFELVRTCRHAYEAWQWASIKQKLYLLSTILTPVLVIPGRPLPHLRSIAASHGVSLTGPSTWALAGHEGYFNSRTESKDDFRFADLRTISNRAVSKCLLFPFFDVSVFCKLYLDILRVRRPVNLPLHSLSASSKSNTSTRSPAPKIPWPT
jgi:hypothetical protein